MASAGKLPQCRVCHTSYKYGGPDPRLLPCLHSVCHTCLDSDTSDTLSCDICDESFSKTDTDFPKDAITAKDVFIQAVQEKDSALLCSNRDDGNQATTWCQDCEAFLCEHCQTAHDGVKILKDHVIVTVEALKTSDKQPSPKHIYCKDHADHPLQLYDETCGHGICFKCLKERHSGCKVVDLETATKTLKEQELHEASKNLREKLCTISAVKKQIDDVLKFAEVKEREVNEVVKLTFCNLRNVLNQREELVSLQVSQSFRAVHDINQLRLQRLDAEQARSETALKFIQKYAAMSSVDGLSSMRKTVGLRTTECVTAPLPQTRSQEAMICFSDETVENLKPSLSSFGTCYVATDHLKETTIKSDARTVSVSVLKNTLKTVEEKNLSYVAQPRKRQIKRYVLKKRITDASRATIRFSVNTNDLKRRYCQLDSPVSMVSHFPMKLKVLLSETAQVESKNVGLFLECLGINGLSSWACRAKVQLTVLSVSVWGDSNKGYTHTFTKDENDWGFKDFISMKVFERIRCNSLNFGLVSTRDITCQQQILHQHIRRFFLSILFQSGT